MRSRVLGLPLGASCTRERVPTREVSEDASVSEGLCCSLLVGFCSVIRGAFCIVPVQASGIFGQVPLACARHSLVRLPCCSRLCAQPLAAAHSALELSLSTPHSPSRHSLSTSLSSSLLPSVSQRTLTPEHALFITSASSGRRHRGHSLPFLFFHPPTFPLGIARCMA